MLTRTYFSKAKPFRLNSGITADVFTVTFEFTANSTCISVQNVHTKSEINAIKGAAGDR